MSQHNTLFSKMLRLIDRRCFKRIVKRYEGDRKVRTLACWDQFVFMLFGQLNGCMSGREALTSFNSFEEKLYHLGSKGLAKSTLNDANAKRDSRIFEDLFQKLLSTYREQFSKTDTHTMLTAIDSTEIMLPTSSRQDFLGKKGKSTLKIHTVYCMDDGIPEDAIISAGRVSDIVVAKRDIQIEAGRIYVYDRGYYDFQWWADIDKKGAYFVTRLKKNAKPTFEKEHTRPASKMILSDHVIRLNQRLASSRQNPYQKALRRVIAKDDEGKEIQLVTNDFESSAEEIAARYKSRWQIELFFKWIKQNLKIKRFYGKSPNAIRTQIYIAMISYLLLKMFREKNLVSRSFIEFTRIIRRHLMSAYQDWWKPFEPPQKRKRKNNNQHILPLFHGVIQYEGC